MIATQKKSFSELWEVSLCQLNSVILASNKIPESFRAMTGRNGVSLEASSYEVGKNEALAEMRMVKIVSPKINIFNMMIFPYYPSKIPVFASELVSIANRCVVFLDLQTPGFQEHKHNYVRELTEDLKKESVGIVNCLEAPAWATDYSLGGYLFSRTSCEYSFHFCTAFEKYLKTWVMLLNQSRDQTSQKNPVALQALSAYKDNHVTHSPGTKFLQSIFGKNESINFLRNFLYQ